MIDIFEALGWLNALNSDSYLNNEVRRLIKGALTLSHSDRRVRLILERLRNAGHSSNDPLEKAEILLHCAAIEYLHRRYSWAVCDVNEAVVSYDKDDHRRAVALWMLG